MKRKHGGKRKRMRLRGKKRGREGRKAVAGTGGRAASERRRGEEVVASNRQ